jgi:hypothetical protein
MMKMLKRLTVMLIAICFLPLAAMAQEVEPMTLQEAVNGYESVTNGQVGLPHDWSSRHLIFSNPAHNGDSYSKVTHDPRYWQQQVWRLRNTSDDQTNAMTAEVLAAKNKVKEEKNTKDGKDKKSKEKVTRDWSVNMGENASVGTVAFPAKYTITPTAASCNDWVVYNTSSAGTAVGIATINSNVNPGDTVQVGSITYTFVNNPSSANQVEIGPDGDPDGSRESAANLQAAINANPGQCILGAPCYGSGTTANTTATATNDNTVTTVTSTSRGTASFTFKTNDTTAITLTFTNGYMPAPSVIGFTNLYKTGCSGTVPKTNWAFDTKGNVNTSPIVSSDGTQIAYIQSVAGVAQLVIVKWKAGSGTITSPVTPTSESTSNYRACSAPCSTAIALNGNPNDSHSDPFYNYSNDSLYVGADDGTLHKFTGVFTGTPAEVTSHWPITVDSNVRLTSPIYDSVSNNIYMQDADGILSYVRDTGSTVGACTGSTTIPCLGRTTVDLVNDGGSGNGLISIDSIMLDSNSKRIFSFVTCVTTSGNSCGDPSDDNPSQVVQVSTDLTTVNRANIGGSSIFDTVYDGDFDNSYYSGNYSSGHLYACGNPRVDQSRYIYGLKFDSAGNLQSTGITQSPAITAKGGNYCSPMTEFDNNGTDRIFVGLTAGGNQSTSPPCTGACIYSFDLPITSSSTATAGLQVTGGTSGIIIDNNQSTPSGASQIYFSNLTNAASCGSTGTGGCAVQASQSGLN